MNMNFNVNQFSNFDIDKERLAIASMSKSNPVVAELYDLLWKYDDVVKSWLMASPQNVQRFNKNPINAIQCVPNIPSEVLKDINNKISALQKKQLKDDNADVSNEYVPPSIEFTNGWDMISATHIQQINAAFMRFFSYPKQSTIKVEARVGDIPIFGKITYEISSFEIIGASDKTIRLQIKFNSIAFLQTFDPWMSIDPQPEAIHFEIKELTCSFDIVLNEVYGKTSSGQDCINVQLAFTEGSTISNVELSAKRPESCERVEWIGILEILEAIFGVFLKRLPTAGPYTVFSVSIDNEKQDKYSWAIPKEMRFTGASTESQELNDYVMGIFSQTINKISSDLMLTIPSGTLSQADSLALAMSQELAAKHIFTPAINKAIDAQLNNGQENNIFKCEKEGAGYVIKSVKEYVIQAEDQSELTLSNSVFRMIDNGLYFETDYYTMPYFINVSGNIRCKILCNLTTSPETDELCVNFITTEPDVTFDTSFSWQMVLILLSLIIIPIIGVTLSAIGFLVVGLLDYIIDLDFQSLEFSMTIPINWNHILASKTINLEISNGILMQFATVTEESKT